VTVVLNGKKIIDNAQVRLTGAALDDKESEPGPIMLQGDHGKVTFRNVRIQPIKS
jgi:3-keto-disaccharide hydrolase